MMYAILALILLFLLGYMLARWLRLVLREGGQATRAALHVARGGRTPQTLVASAGAAIAEAGGRADWIIAAHDADGMAARYRARAAECANGEAPEPILFALAVDVTNARLFLHGIAAESATDTREFAELRDFSEVAALEHIAAPASVDRGPDVTSALRICLTGSSPRCAKLLVEPEWRIRASDLQRRLHAAIAEREPPDPSPVILH